MKIQAALRGLSAEQFIQQAFAAALPRYPETEGQRRNAVAGPAFTLVEVIVIICLLAFLGSIAATAFTRTRPSSQAFQCMHNLRQLGSAWLMYGEENSGRFPPNVDGGSTSDSWVGGWLDFNYGNAGNTNVNYLVNHDLYKGSVGNSGCGHLGPYVKNPALFRCPADHSLARFSWGSVPRVRSYSMNNMVGEHNRSWTLRSAYRTYRKISDLSSPSPAALMVILEEREDCINDGCFFSDPDTPWQIVDYPGFLHDGAGALAFADGHSEMKHWRDPRTMPPLRAFNLLPLNVNLPGDVDVQWLQEHCSAWRQ